MIHLKTISNFSCIGPRPNQEDFLYPIGMGKDERVFVVCDGMGGHGHGEVASKTVGTSVYEYLKALDSIEYEPENLQDALDFAVQRLAAINIVDDEKTMGTTLVVVVVNRMNLLIGHVGDSRAYIFDENGIKRFRTKDHSKVQEAVDAEILTEEEAASSPYKNRLTRCILADSKKVTIEVDDLTINDGETLLICTDGVNDALSDSKIESILIDREIKNAAEIIKAECATASHDNHSAILIRFSQDETTTEQTPFYSNKTDNKISCPYCGESINASSMFCSVCGNKLIDTISPSIRQDIQITNPIRSNKRIWCWGIVLLFFAVVATVMIIYRTDRNKNRTLLKQNIVISDTVTKPDFTSPELFFPIQRKCVPPFLTDSLYYNKSLLPSFYNNFNK